LRWRARSGRRSQSIRTIWKNVRTAIPVTMSDRIGYSRNERRSDALGKNVR
jgi:hypothetical protein